ncbi:MAG TPA: hypothetical protein VGL84_04105 [Gaiellaceae bacterium]|jgi:hypothetical protein
MRRGIEIRVAFVPTRLSATYLRAAYAVVRPVVECAVVAGVQREVAEEHEGAAPVARRRRKEGGSR